MKRLFFSLDCADAHNGYIHKYTTDEVDMFMLYCIELDEVYVVPHSDLSNITLRLVAPKNNKYTGIRMAFDFSLANQLARLFRGEPLLLDPITTEQSFLYREHFGDMSKINTNKYNSCVLSAEYENRKRLIEESNIDFSRFGWGMKLSKLFGLSSAQTVRWVKHYMPDFYERECYKKPSISDIDTNLVKGLYSKYHSIALVATELGVDRTLIATILHNANIKTSKKLLLSVDMLLDDNGDVVQSFSSLKEAAIYCIDVLKCKTSSSTPVKVISRAICKCVNGRQKTAYGFKWQEHIDDTK